MFDGAINKDVKAVWIIGEAPSELLFPTWTLDITI
jgi:hypothetical protein